MEKRNAMWRWQRRSSLIAAIFVILLLPELRYQQVVPQTPVWVSAQRNVDRARAYAGREALPRHLNFSRYSSGNEPAVHGFVVIRRWQRNAITINRGSGNVVANEVGVIGDAPAR